MSSKFIKASKSKHKENPVITDPNNPGYAMMLSPEELQVKQEQAEKFEDIVNDYFKAKETVQTNRQFQEKFMAECVGYDHTFPSGTSSETAERCLELITLCLNHAKTEE